MTECRAYEITEVTIASQAFRLFSCGVLKEADFVISNTDDTTNTLRHNELILKVLEAIYCLMI